MCLKTILSMDVIWVIFATWNYFGLNECQNILHVPFRIRKIRKSQLSSQKSSTINGSEENSWKSQLKSSCRRKIINFSNCVLDWWKYTPRTPSWIGMLFIFNKFYTLLTILLFLLTVIK